VSKFKVKRSRSRSFFEVKRSRSIGRGREVVVGGPDAGSGQFRSFSMVFLRVFARFSADFRAVSSAVRASGLGSGPGRSRRQPQQRLRTCQMLRSSQSYIDSAFVIPDPVAGEGGKASLAIAF